MRAAYDYLIVGAGFAGSVLAERLAATDQRVLLIDRRPHVGGNAYDAYDDAGILVHRYGPHIFHTNSAAVFEYLSRFTAWRPYEHRVLADVGGLLVPMPINRRTVSLLAGREMSSAEVSAYLASVAEPRDPCRSAEDVVVGQVGRRLYEQLYRTYTRKQWGLDPSKLDARVTRRLPIRVDDDDRYFTDTYQAMPADGYTRMFERMLAHPNIDVALDTDFRELPTTVSYDSLIYTGPIDEYFDHRYGWLPYRSLNFEHVTLDVARHLPAAVVNHPTADVPYTRVTEFKWLTGQQHARTSLAYEYPTDAGDPYYPVLHDDSRAIMQRYREAAERTPDVYFTGRLATFQYYNMDQVVAQSLALFARLSGGRWASGVAQPVGT
jgi:UDP-galactopyranose mutase